jgi:threonine/homoserine/homoserine lactone efflux protein
MLKYLIMGASFGLAAAVQPGPFVALLTSQAAKHGYRRTLPATLAPLLSDGPIIVITLFVLTELPIWFTQWMRLAGGAVTLYMAFGILRTALAPESAATAPPASQNLFKAALINFFNPNPWLSWSVILGPILAQAWRESVTHAAALVGSFYGVMIPGLALVVVILGVTGQSSPRAGKTLALISGIALAAFGAYLLWTGVSATLLSPPHPLPQPARPVSANHKYIA